MDLSPRYCRRCNEETHGAAQDQPHLCKDIARRLARRERQVQAILPYLENISRVKHYPQAVAKDIVATLANLGVEND